MVESIFEKIAKRELPAFIIWEDDEFMAFLSIDPLSLGHTLVVPKQNWGDKLFALKDDEYSRLLIVAKRVAEILDSKMPNDRVLMWVEGYLVPHVHVHLVPSVAGVGLHNTVPKRAQIEELEEVYRQLID